MKNNGAIVEFEKKGDIGSWQYLNKGIFNELITTVLVKEGERNVRIHIKLTKVLSTDMKVSNLIEQSLLDSEETAIKKDTIAAAFDAISQNIWMLEGEIIQSKKNIPVILLRDFNTGWASYGIKKKVSKRSKNKSMSN